jgi:hypothetical protein
MKTPKRAEFIAVVTALMFAAAPAVLDAIAAPEEHPKPAAPLPAGLNLMKSLAGTWTGQFSEGGGKETNPATDRYQVTGGGSTVMENMAPGTEYEMVTMYYAEGDDVCMTHYCAIGNHPKMKAARQTDPKVLSFDFAGSGVANPAVDGHMHSLKLEFPDKDHLIAHWNFYKDGKSTGESVFDLKRSGN